ncbi:sigma-54-dependent Fis family transcriptional regulator [Acidisphaera rubrifaciens]|uniref:Transcriptional regulator Fis n=1 Tax=Acidisphaera rubrifaciens HS-AP3 TaxID=1231350 RepID=A0A0D6PBG8_9PROT|nr:sigma-54-dependent Fis family transcriptional regulator [Acidisphaera rubrifaciens]GAN78199.1 transcriptional regulator Fis [Acidisphaera rubrifaciens HS-AP3]
MPDDRSRRTPDPDASLPSAQLMRRAEGSDTMLAWERFLTGGPQAARPERHFVVASWLRSRDLGIDPRARAAPLLRDTDRIEGLRERHRELISAACGVFGDAADLLAGSRSILLLTSPEGIVLEVVGDTQTQDQGQDINLTQGGDWREDVIGTNGIGTAIATGRPAHVHAAEHFCEGVKSWTCAASPIMDASSGRVLGVVDISGPPTTYQRTNLTLAVTLARQIEMVLAERAVRERSRLLEACLDRLSSSDAAGLLAIDRSGRLIHSTGRAPAGLRVGQHLPGMDDEVPVESWSDRLPEGLQAEWFNPVRVAGRTIGAMVVIPTRAGRPPGGAARGLAAPRLAASPSEVDPTRSSFAAIVGDSPAMLQALQRARHLADKRVAVLIEGETGVGKELFARAMHGDGGAPFIAYNCGAVARELIAAELFGHVRGAYTGATSEGRSGRFELAHGGTLCLDEIGEMPIEVQPFLLRTLEEGVVYRLGETQPRRLDVRLLALTNRNLADEVESGRFRRDLFYRIAVTRVRIPPLRERPDDVARLIAHFNARLAQRHGVVPRCYGPAAMAMLEGYAWPGNVRELRNVVEELLLIPADGDVTEDELRTLLPAAGAVPPPDPPPEAAVCAPLPTPAPTPSPAVALPSSSSAPAQPPLFPDARPSSPAATSLEEAECAAIIQAVQQHHGNFAEAARALGIARSTLYRKAERYGINLVGAARGWGSGRMARN